MKTIKKILPSVFILMGPPLSGKGTQSEMLANHFGFIHFSLGDILREKSKNDKIIKKTMEEGKLLPNKIVNQIFAASFPDLEKSRGIVIDGYPRNLNQARFLVDFLAKLKKDFLVIYLEVKEDFLLDRLLKRKYCPVCHEVFKDNETICPVCGVELVKREDDDPKVLENRLKMFNKNTMKAIKFFEKQRKLIKVDGEKTIEEVFKEILGRLDEFSY